MAAASTSQKAVVLADAATVLQIIYDQETGRSRGFGFIKFEDQRDADDAIVEADGKASDLRPPLQDCLRDHTRHTSRPW